MSALSTRSEGASAAERELLNSRCTVMRPGARAGVRDPETGLIPDGTPTTVVADAPCWLKMPSQASPTTVGGDVVLALSPTLSLSVSAPALQPGDVATITASPVAVNVGRTVTIKSVYGGDLVVLARYEVGELA